MRSPSLARGMVVSLSTMMLLGKDKPVSVEFQRDPQQRDPSGVAGQRADGDRVGGVEAVVLQDQHGARFARVMRTSGRGPQLTAPHSSSSSLFEPRDRVDECSILGRMRAGGR